MYFFGLLHNTLHISTVVDWKRFHKQDFRAVWRYNGSLSRSYPRGINMLSPDLKRQIVELSISERLEIMQEIVASLQNHPIANKLAASNYFEPGKVYEVWTPIEAPDAAQTLLNLLASETPNHE
jgi:hypothetical protein